MLLRTVVTLSVLALALVGTGIYLFYPSQHAMLRAGYSLEEYDSWFSGSSNDLPELTHRVSRFSTLRNSAVTRGDARFEDAVIIPMGDSVRNNQMYWAYSYVFKHLSQHASSLMAYPFDMSVKNDRVNDTAEAVPLEHGAFLRFVDDDGDWRIRGDRAIRPKNVQLNTGYPLYASNIAILKVRKDIDGVTGDRDLTYSSTYFCRALQSYLGAYRQCFLRDQWEQYLEDTQIARREPSSIVYLTASDVSDDYLFETDVESDHNGEQLRFGVLMIPDTILGHDKDIVDALGPVGVKNIKKFIAAGGNVFISAKGSAVAERLGLLPSGSVDRRNLITAQANMVGVDGCRTGQLKNLPVNDQNNFRRLMCLGLRTPEAMRNHPELNPAEDERVYPDFLLSSYPVDLVSKNGDGVNSPKWSQMLSFNTTYGKLRVKDAATGEQDAWAGAAPGLAYYGTMGAGRLVFLQTHTTAFTEAYFPLFFNTVLGLMSRPGAMMTHAKHNLRYKSGEHKGELMPFPALENDLKFQVDVQLMNMHTSSISSVDFRLEICQYLNVTSLPSGNGVSCRLETDETTMIYSDKLPRPTKSAVVCHVSNMAGNQALSFDVDVLVWDARGTNYGNSVPIGIAGMNYTRPGGDLEEILGVPIRLPVQRAPLLRGALNLDPLGTYPLPGKSFTADPILSVQNRDAGTAYNTYFESIVPLVAPSTGAGDETALAYHLGFLPEYFEAGWAGRDNFKMNYPFSGTAGSARDADYIDLRSLVGKGVVLVVEWDDATYVTREDRTEGEVLGKKFNFKPLVIDPAKFSTQKEMLASITNSGFYLANSTYQVYKQLAYNDADSFLEHANFRLMPYAEFNTPEGFKTYCGDINGLPADIQPERRRHCATLVNPRSQKVDSEPRGRYELNIQRTDVFFRTNHYYDEKELTYAPLGLRPLLEKLYPADKDRLELNKVFVTVDKYGDMMNTRRHSPQADGSDFIENPTAKELSVHGYLSNQQSVAQERKAKWRGPGLFPNEFVNPLLDSGRWLIHWDDVPVLDLTKPVEDQPLRRSYWYWNIEQATPGAVDYRDYANFYPVNGVDGACGVPGYYKVESLWDVDHKTKVTYDDVIVERAHQINFGLPAETNRIGGQLMIDLPAGYAWAADAKPIENGLIQWAVDHISIMETRVVPAGDHQRIVATFRRGNMPDERYPPTPSEINLVLSQLKYNGKDAASECQQTVDQTTGLTVETFPYDQFNVTVSASTLQWDFTQANVETYQHADAFYNGTDRRTFVHSVIATADAKPFLRLPALHTEYHLRNNTGDALTVRPYEKFEQFTRSRTLYQELSGHRTLWGSIEAHSLRNDPGVASKLAAFAVPTFIGTSAVPFHDFTNHGLLALPYGTVTAQVRWKDLWGRRNSQPMRTLMLDVPPIPPPVRNYWMQQTFEILDKETGERYQTYPADRDVVVHVQMKMLNNYPKYFDATRCVHNDFAKPKALGGGGDYFWTNVIGKDLPDAVTYMDQASPAPVNKYLVATIANSKYGYCYSEPGSVLGGHKLSTGDIEIVKKLIHCMESEGPEECEKYKVEFHLSKRHGNEDKKGSKWNFSPSVLDWYPEGYILSSMWDFTMMDYSDDLYYKSYPFHMDNHVPNLANGINNMDNLLAVPVWKGFGYDVTFDKDLVLPNMPDGSPRPGSSRFGHVHHGLWSDNLQNTDDTLLAGQDEVKYFAAGLADSDYVLQPDDWVHYSDFANVNITANETTLANGRRVKNGLVCLFNPRSIAPELVDDADGHFHLKKYAYLANVAENNVVPVPVRLSRNDQFYKNFDCENAPFYAPHNISAAADTKLRYSNYLKTREARDWMYFGVNLRGNAEENLHLALDVKPHVWNGEFWEGDFKAFDGARFSYWNPALSRNAWLIVDGETNVARAVRSDIEVTGWILPNWVQTHNPRFWYATELNDKAEWNKGRLREMTETYWTEHYGFGDSNVNVYLGSDSTSINMQPGSNYTLRIELYNNAGFDWTMKPEAYDGTDACLARAKAAGPGAVLEDYCVDIGNVTSFNFISLDPSSELAPYVKMNVSHFITLRPDDPERRAIEPLFFDLPDYNPPRVRDGFRAVFYLDFHLDENFPRNLWGSMHEVPIKIDFDQAFYRYPGSNIPRCTTDAERLDRTKKCDPTGPNVDHDYTLSSPPVRFGVPFPKDGIYATSYPYKWFAGRVFWASGKSVDISTSFTVPKRVDLHRAIVMDPWEYDDFQRTVGRGSPGETFDRLAAHYDSKAIFQPWMNFTKTAFNDTHDTVTVTLNPANLDAEYAHSLPRRSVRYEDVYVNGTDAASHTRQKLATANDDPLPDMGKMFLVFNATMPFTGFGFQEVAGLHVVNYTDATGNSRGDDDHLATKLIEVKGASLVTEISHAVVDPTTRLPKVDQWLLEDQMNTLRCTLYAMNDGDDACYKVRGRFTLGDNVTVVTDAAFQDDDVKITSMGNGTFEVKSESALPPGESLILPFYVNVTTSHNGGANDEDITILSDAEARYELKSSGKASAVTQPLTNDIDIAYSLGPDSSFEIPLSVLKLDEEHASLSTLLPSDPRADVCRTNPTACQYAWSWKYSTDAVFNKPVVTDTPEFVHRASTGFTADVTYRVTLTRVFDESVGPQSMGASALMHEHFIGSLSAVSRVVLITVYVAVALVGTFVFFGYDAVGKWVEEDRLLNCWPVAPSVANDPVDRAVVREVNKAYRREGKLYKVERLGAGEYRIGGTAVSVTDLKRSIFSLRKTPKLKVEGSDESMSFKVFENQFCLTEFSESVLSELTPSLRSHIRKQQRSSGYQQL